MIMVHRGIFTNTCIKSEAQCCTKIVQLLHEVKKRYCNETKIYIRKWSDIQKAFEVLREFLPSYVIWRSVIHVIQ